MASYQTCLKTMLALLFCCFVAADLSAQSDTGGDSAESGAPESAAPKSDSPAFERIDWVMFNDPKFPVYEKLIKISPGPIPLWIDALKRPDPMLRRVTIDTIAIAHSRGMPGIEETIPHMAELLEDKGLSMEVRQAIVRALIKMDVEEQSDLLFALAQQYGPAIASIVEKAMLEQESPLFVEAWLQRIEDPAARRDWLLTAIEGLGRLKVEKATDKFAEFVSDPALSARIRLASADALGGTKSTGLTAMARSMTDIDPPAIVSDLLAIKLLGTHTDADSVALLKSLVGREATVVQSEALKRLYEIENDHVLEFVETRIGSPDVNVRRTLAMAMIRDRKSQWIAPLATLLDDVNPGLRSRVAESLYGFAQDPSMKDEVISEVTGILDQDQWRGCEQATYVLVNLQHLGAGDRLVDLLRHPRGEVMIAAGWGLRRLADKKHLPAMLGRGQEIYDGFKKGTMNEKMPGFADLAAQLFLAFGQMKYVEADQLVRAYIPKSYTLGVRPRTAAAWAIGYMHEGESDPDLIDLLVGRIKDLNSVEPEFAPVARMSAISLGRMKSESALPTLRKNATQFASEMSRASHWAIERLTGEKPPTFDPPPEVDYDDWFLRPIRDFNE